ncbi:holin family protein [Roseobacter sp. S98]|uniref:holin family protein n=1 Tax=Roseobacter algicola (ex Choi et al. 2025) (nom. illeg.) TaxID=3092138 RepID=UPI0035C76CCB
MGLITGILNTIFGGGRNVLKDTVEVFRENAEEDAMRDQELRIESLKQYAAEFETRRDGLFDRIMDGVNRLPRPALALGTLGLFIAAMADPAWFAARMQGIALVPEPLWWLLGVIVSFYFGARHQVKSQQFQRSIAQTVARAPQVIQNIAALRALTADTPGVADTGPDSRLGLAALQPEPNAALNEWKTTVPPATK